MEDVIPQLSERYRTDRIAVGGVAALGDVAAHTWPGGHDGDYRDAHWRDSLRWYARRLERR
jgi:hypothetical protein